MKILFICNEYPPNPYGGIGSFTKLMAESLEKNGHQAIVFGYGKTDSIRNINGVTVIFIKKPNNPRNIFISFFLHILNRYVFFLKLKKAIEQYRPDLIETYDWSAPLVFKIKGTQTVLRMHGSNSVFNTYANIPLSRVYYYFEKRSFKNADYLVSVSDFIGNESKSLFNLNKRIMTIYNGVDINRFHDLHLKRDKNQLLLVGRMHPYKGFDDLFRALNHVFDQNRDVYLNVICTVIESYKNSLLKLVDKKHHGRINFLGRIPNEELVNYYNRTNVLILPSKTEAFPIIPLEAMACGTPVIISDRFSAREIVEDNVDGFLVNTLDKSVFANRMIEIIGEQDEIELMRQKVRNKIVQNFSIEKIIKDNILFYQSVISN